MDRLPDFLKLQILNQLPQARVVTSDEAVLAPVDLRAARPSALWSSATLDALRERGVAVVDGLLGAESARAVRGDIEALAAAGRLKQAGMKVRQRAPLRSSL